MHKYSIMNLKKYRILNARNRAIRSLLALKKMDSSTDWGFSSYFEAAKEDIIQILKDKKTTSNYV